MTALLGISKAQKVLRDYQLECLSAVRTAFQSASSAVMVMATGLGKTAVASRLAAEWTAGNVLWVVHRIELVDQAAQSIACEVGYDPIIEQADRGADLDMIPASGAIVCGSIQTMITPRRQRKFRSRPFGLVVIDEAHRATSPSYRNLIDYYRTINPALKVLLVTATPNRTDGTSLGVIDETMVEAYQMGIIAGIDQGWLVDVHQQFGILEEVDFDNIKCTRNEFGEMDFKREDLERVMSEESSLHAMSRPVLDMTDNREQAIIFASSVSHAHLWAMVLNRYRPGSSAAVDGGTDKQERENHVKAYRAGELQFLLNYGVFTEGFDAPATDIVVMGRPTKSKLVYTQMLGRGTRPIPGSVDGIATADGRRDAIAASEKPYLTVLDFVGNSRHKIVSAVDVLGGTYTDYDNEAAARRLKKKAGNVRAEIRKAAAAKALIEEEQKRQKIKFKKDDIKYKLQAVSPFDHGEAGGVVQQNGSSRGTATDAQVNVLMGFGVKYDVCSRWSRGKAGAVIEQYKKVRCTANQARLLERYGFDPKNFNSYEASNQIEQIASNGWKR